jgi:LysW-gamma-L-lysine carboxypeptidase
LSQALEAVELLRNLVRLYSPSGREKAVASTIHRWLTTHSAFDNVEIDAVGNVVATRGRRPFFLLCGHMDTVPGRLPISFEGGFVRGRGAVDAKASLAAMCVASSAAVADGARGIMYAAVVGEETDGKGMKEVLSIENQYIGGAFGEPSGGGIVIGYRGRLGLQLEVRGRSAHASSAALGVNAVETGMKLALQLKDDLNALGCAAAVTIVRGGEAENIIPAKCRVAMDVRIPATLSLDEALGVIQKAGHEGIRIRTPELTPPINVGRANPVFGAMSQAAREAGMPSRALTKAGTSDMSLFYTSTKAPCVAYGPGDASLSHTEHEIVSEAEYIASIKVYTSAIKKVLRV